MFCHDLNFSLLCTYIAFDYLGSLILSHSHDNKDHSARGQSTSAFNSDTQFASKWAVYCSKFIKTGIIVAFDYRLINEGFRSITAIKRFPYITSNRRLTSRFQSSLLSVRSEKTASLCVFIFEPKKHKTAQPFGDLSLFLTKVRFSALLTGGLHSDNHLNGNNYIPVCAVN